MFCFMKIVAFSLTTAVVVVVAVWAAGKFHFVAIFRFFGICLSGQGSEIGKAGSRGKRRQA